MNTKYIIYLGAKYSNLMLKKEVIVTTVLWRAKE
jgi:hypothetical protein